jgi:hypothetical protein
MDDIFISLWPPAWVEDHTLSDEQLVAAGEDVKLMSALRSDERVLLSVSWPGGRRYLMIDPHGDAAPEAFCAGATLDGLGPRSVHRCDVVAGAATRQAEPGRRATVDR